MPLVPRLIFASRWLQLPLYMGLILAQAVYVYHFWVELVASDRSRARRCGRAQALITSIGYQLHGDQGRAGTVIGFEKPQLNETVIMLVVLGLIDVVMISNLLIMVIVGGYETFVSRMNLEGHPDQPEWLSHVNACVLKVKLATAIIGISSIHLLKTFINAAELRRQRALIAQTVIHIDVPAFRAWRSRRTDRIDAGAFRQALTINEHEHGEHPPSRPDRKRRRRAAVHQLLPPGRLHQPSRARVRGEQSAAAKDAIAQILTNSRMCAEGKRPICQDTGIVNVFPEDRHGRAMGGLHRLARGRGQRRRAPRLQPSRQPAARVDRRSAGVRPQEHRRQHAGRR